MILYGITVGYAYLSLIMNGVFTTSKSSVNNIIVTIAVGLVGSAILGFVTHRLHHHHQKMLMHFHALSTATLFTYGLSQFILLAKGREINLSYFLGLPIMYVISLMIQNFQYKNADIEQCLGQTHQN